MNQVRKTAKQFCQNCASQRYCNSAEDECSQYREYYGERKIRKSKKHSWEESWETEMPNGEKLVFYRCVYCDYEATQQEIKAGVGADCKR